MIAIIVGGFILSTGYASDSSKSGEQAAGDFTGNENPGMIPQTMDSLTSMPSDDEKLSAEALTCTISDSGTHVVDFRLRNPGSESRTMTIVNSGMIVALYPGQIKRIDIPFAEEVAMINILVDDGTELRAAMPTCTTRGGSGSGASNTKNMKLGTSSPSPPAPVPELSPLVLTIAGISGLLLLSRARKN